MSFQEISYDFVNNCHGLTIIKWRAGNFHFVVKFSEGEGDNSLLYPVVLFGEGESLWVFHHCTCTVVAFYTCSQKWKRLIRFYYDIRCIFSYRKKFNFESVKNGLVILPRYRYIHAIFIKFTPYIWFQAMQMNT